MGEARPISPAGDLRPARVALTALLLAVALFTVSTLPGVRQEPGFDVLLDGWLQGAAYVLAAVAAVLRPATRQHRRLLWSVLAAAVVLRSAGFVVYLSVVRRMDPAPYPSAADLCWLASSAALLVAVTLLLRVDTPRLSVIRALDGVVGALTVATVVFALFYDTLAALTVSGTPADVVVTNLAYPLIDVALLMMVAALWAASGWWPSPRLLALGLGVVALAVVDVVFLYQVTAGTYRPGTPLAALSLAATALIALTPWITGRGGRRASDREVTLLVPSGLALVCVITLVVEPDPAVPVLTPMLAVAGVVVAIVRAFVTLSTDRRSASLEIADQQLQLERFRALVDASSDFIAIAGTDGGVLYVNPAGRRIVGLEPDTDVTTTTIADYLTEEGLRASSEIEQPAVMTRGHWEGESTLRDLRGGPPTPVAIASFMMLHPRTGEPWLLATVQRDISGTLEAERSLQELADQRQALLERLVQAEEEERARIAADVHDDSVQALAAVELRMLLLRREVERSAPELLPTLEGVRESVSHATDRLRHLLFDLESPAQRTDLANALADAAAYVFEDAVRWSVEGDTGVDVPEGIRVTAYRIAREAMVNVRKHAGAQRVRIGLERTTRGVEVTVSDDGVGIDPTGLRHRPGHLGIAGMRERAVIAGGGLEIEPRDEGGTTVRLWLPEPTPGVRAEEPARTS